MVLDADFEIEWVWNTFEQLDIARRAAPDNICRGAGCPNLGDRSGGIPAEDWTHADSIDYSPDDGNLIVSIRNQDWVVNRLPRWRGQRCRVADLMVNIELGLRRSIVVRATGRPAGCRVGSSVQHFVVGTLSLRTSTNNPG